MFCSPGSGLLIIHIDVAVRHFGGACLGAEAQILSGNIRDSHICGGSALRGQLAREGDRKRDLTLYFVGGGGGINLGCNMESRWCSRTTCWNSCKPPDSVMALNKQWIFHMIFILLSPLTLLLLLLPTIHPRPASSPTSSHPHPLRWPGQARGPRLLPRRPIPSGVTLRSLQHDMPYSGSPCRGRGRKNFGRDLMQVQGPLITVNICTMWRYIEIPPWGDAAQSWTSFFERRFRFMLSIQSFLS